MAGARIAAATSLTALAAVMAFSFHGGQPAPLQIAPTPAQVDAAVEHAAQVAGVPVPTRRR